MARERPPAKIASRDYVTRRFGCSAASGTNAMLNSDAMPARNGEVR